MAGDMTNAAHGLCGSRVKRPVGQWWCWLLCSAALVGCGAGFNWRLVRPAGFSLQATLPCKPDAAQRTVGLGGQSAELHMLSCETGGLTFALSALRLPPGIESATVLQGWKQASLLSLKLSSDKAQAWALPARLKGAVAGWQAEGVRHDGSPVKANVVMLVRGAEVFQLAVYGAATPEVLTAVLDGLSLDAQP